MTANFPVPRFAGTRDYAGAMASPTRAERIALLSRENRGRKSKASFLADLSKAVGSPVAPGQLANLESTDLVLKDLRSGYSAAVAGNAPALRRFFAHEKSERALYFVALLAKTLNDEPALLWLKLSSVCGAVVLTTKQILIACERLRALDGDCVSFLSADHSQGFLFDHNPDAADETYEVAVWGDQWSAAAFEAMSETDSSSCGEAHHSR
jgi:hypothetical protein